MSSQAAQRMGFQVAVLDTDQQSPAAQVGASCILKDWNSEVGAIELAHASSVITLENEWVKPENLMVAEGLGCPVVPGPKTLAIIGDKLEQRRVLVSHSLRSPRFAPLRHWDDVCEFATEWGAKCVVLKARRGGYDGYGVRIMDIGSDAPPTSDAEQWFVEEYMPFSRELAVMVSKNGSGQTSVFSVVESRQTLAGNRCDTVIAPAPNLTAAQAAQIQDMALQAVEAVEGTGLFGIELFQVGDEFLVNEIAPRPHNSGHYTMDGCRTSQFEQHIRAVKNLPPGPTDLLAPVVIMLNLLAPGDGPVPIGRCTESALASCADIHLHWYGKRAMRNGRKMGHLNLLGDTVENTLALANAARDAFWKGLD
jgi:5-(carboxyamino)imidazole ribonucleotide synthase